MHAHPVSLRILEHNRRFIPGGISSVNRAADPGIVFVRGDGAYMWDVEGNRYIDYHAAFAPHFLGHNHPRVNAAVIEAMQRGESLYGAGTTEAEGRLAELVCGHVPAVEAVAFLNTGSEATYQALRVARAHTGREHIIVMQGGYNGWHNDVACNLMTPLTRLGPRLSPGEYAFEPISAGIPPQHRALVHAVNFNDLESVRYVCDRYPVAALITEPILQNIGIVKPEPGYLAGLRALADEYGFVLVFDEVKTGFRHALGGYSAICGVTPDLVCYGKAIANGYPLAVLGGRRVLMDYFTHPSASRRVLLAGTYNCHPVTTAAAIATIACLADGDGAVYRHVERLGSIVQEEMESLIAKLGLNAVIARQGSAFCLYFMDHLPRDWHDVAAHHHFDADTAMRRELIDRGIYFFPVAVKQCSLSAAHTEGDVETTLREMAVILQRVVERPALSARAD